MEGVRTKPDSCRTCPMFYLGSGFVPDYNPSHPKILLILDIPTKEDITKQAPLSGSMGNFIEWKVLKEAGLRREDVAISNVLRCHCDKTEYPSGRNKKLAERECRKYDSVIDKFKPNLFVMTYSMRDTFKDAAFLALMIEDFKKAVKLAENKEYKVCILCGEYPISMVNSIPFQDGKGGLRQWRGNYFGGSW